jgi:phage I-like protein
VELGTAHEPPTEFRIFRKGENPTEKGTFLFDDQAAASVMANYALRGKVLRIDYNHGTTIQDPTPEMAIAAGSFVPEVRDGELWATNVQWTARAAGYLAAGEYCEFSPLFNHDKNRITWVRNLALTNLPAMDQTIPLVAANANDEGDEDMTTECTACAAKDQEMAKMLGQLTALAADFELFKKKGEPDGDEGKTKMAALRSLASEVSALTGETEIASAIGVLRAHKKDAGETAALRAKTETDAAVKLTSDFNALVEEAVTSLRVEPAKKAEFEKEYQFDGKITGASVQALRSFIKHTSPQKNGGAGTPQRKTGASLLTDADREAARLLGNSIEDVQAYKESLLNPG